MARDKYKGLETGMRVQWYQDYTLEQNKKHSDRQFVELWHKEHPQALKLDKQNKNGVFTYVRDIRRDYNKGTKEHGARDVHGNIVGTPKVKSLPYDENGKQYVYEGRWWQANFGDRKKLK